MPKYIRKPIIVSATQFFPNVFPWPDGVIEIDKNEWVVDTLEGRMHVLSGDYIIRGIKNELYPCKPEIFHKLYDRIEE